MERLLKRVAAVVMATAMVFLPTVSIMAELNDTPSGGDRSCPHTSVTSNTIVTCWHLDVTYHQWQRIDVKICNSCHAITEEKIHAPVPERHDYVISNVGHVGNKHELRKTCTEPECRYSYTYLIPCGGPPCPYYP